ncbi:MAG: hypothetical protein PHU81_01500 [Acidobacteriota bacterium]|nr:hypothetical protein [Acidobacteriota bacterium]
MKKLPVFIFILAFSGLLTMAEEINISGNWTLTITTQRGERSNNVIFTQQGEKLEVTMKTQRGEIKGEGTVKSNEIEWTITRETSRGQITTTYKGKIEDKNNMSGEVKMGDFGTASWKAVRQPA